MLTNLAIIFCAPLASRIISELDVAPIICPAESTAAIAPDMLGEIKCLSRYNCTKSLSRKAENAFLYKPTCEGTSSIDLAFLSALLTAGDSIIGIASDCTIAFIVSNRRIDVDIAWRTLLIATNAALLISGIAANFHNSGAYTASFTP